jgi:hypothetical protein
MISILGVGTPSVMAASRRPVEQGHMPPPARSCHRSCGVILHAGACLGLLLVVTLVSTY